MDRLRHLLSMSVVLCCAAVAGEAQQPVGPPLTAEAVMARVAANQDKAEAARSHYIYVQHARMTSRRGKKVMCEETTDYRVTPSGSYSHFQLVKLDGRVWHKGAYVTYDHLKPDHPSDAAKDSEAAVDKHSADRPQQEAAKQSAQTPTDKSAEKPGIVIDSDGDLDRDLVENMRRNLLNSKSKDGIESGLFPLTSKAQADYAFQLIGSERLNGRDVYHIVFRPKDKNDFSWRGDAYIDQATCEPVLVTTGLSRKIPFAVRTLLGTDVPGLGFTIVYAPQPDGVWFPSTFSTEFKIHVLYFFHREILLNAENRDFEQTHVDSKILEGFTPIEKP